MKQSLVFLERITAVLTVFLLPTQLALHFWPTYSFIFGIRVDYLSPTIYLTDLLVASLLVFLFINQNRDFLAFLKKRQTHLLIFLALALVNVIFSTQPTISTYRWIKISEALFLVVYFYLRKFFLGERIIFKSLFFSSVFYSFLGICQFVFGRTTGLLYVLGERSFNLLTPGIALFQIGGQDFLRAYSTFPHPNALAGFLGIVLVFVFSSRFLEMKKIYYFGLLILGICFLLSFSITAFIGILILIFLAFLKVNRDIYRRLIFIFMGSAVLASLLLPVISETVFKTIPFSSKIAERLDLSFISGKMIADRFFTGEGLGTFIINSVRFRGVVVYSWLLQPVHNIFLLVFAETGIFGLLVFCYAIYKIVKYSVDKRNHFLISVLFFVLFTGLTDHYWLTLQQNILFLSFIFGYSLRLKK